MADEVVGYRANGVAGAVEQVNAAVTIKIHGKFVPAGGHELTEPHGTCIAAAQRKWVAACAVGGDQHLFQLAPEIVGAGLGAGVRLRKVQRQRGQGIHHAEVAHVAAIDGFHADDADDDFGGHAKLLLGTRKRLAVGMPELHTGANAHGVDKAAAVHRPVFHKGLACGRHQTGDHGQILRFTQLRTHPVGRQVAAGGNVVGQLHGITPAGIGHGGGGCCSRGYGGHGL